MRDRRDRCPGALRPWPADDGLLVRLRVPGGRVPVSRLQALGEFAQAFGDGHVHVTSRANLQVRGLPGEGGALDPAALEALEATGLLPTRTHELIRNVMVSPQSGLVQPGLAGGRADLRPVAAQLDRLLCANARLADLPGRFLFVLDDGRGDLLDRGGDLGLVALDADTVQLRVGEGWGDLVPLADAAHALADLADRFMDLRGSGPTAPWHVVELDVPLAPERTRDPRVPQPAAPLPFGEVPGGRHVPVPESGLDQEALTTLSAETPFVIITPWRGLLIPHQQSEDSE